MGPIRDACRNSKAYVYLAVFGRKLKVGVSREDRCVKRWIEQGADAALRVLTGNGSEVRRLEHEIHTQFGVPESVRVGHKVSSLCRENKTTQALTSLAETRRQVHTIASSNQRFNEDPWILAPHYNIPNFEQKPILLKVNDGVTVAGEVVGVKGPVMLLRKGEVFFVLGLSALLGRTIELMSEDVRNQTGLYSFLKR